MDKVTIDEKDTTNGKLLPSAEADNVKDPIPADSSKLDKQRSDPEWSKKATITLINSFIGMTGYLIIGAAVFSAIELPEERRSLQALKANTEKVTMNLVQQIVNRSLLDACENEFEECFASVDLPALYNQSFRTINSILDHLGFSHFDANPTNDQVVLSWDLAGAIYFCITTVTTIGYGNITPTLEETRALTILYTLIGIPGFLYTCSQLSQLFSYGFFCLRTAIGVDSNTPRRLKYTKGAVYYLVCAIVILGFLFVLPIPVLVNQAGLSYVSAFYFLIITLTTVGFGDIYPVDPSDPSESTLAYRFGFSFAIWVYMILGLSLFGNLINLIEKIIIKASSMCQEKIESEIDDVIETAVQQSKNIHVPYTRSQSSSTNQQKPTNGDVIIAPPNKSQTTYSNRTQFGVSGF